MGEGGRAGRDTRESTVALTPSLSHPKRTGEGERRDGTGTPGRDTRESKAALTLSLSHPKRTGEGRGGTGLFAGGDQIPSGDEKWICWWWGSFFTKEKRIPTSKRWTDFGRTGTGTRDGTRAVGRDTLADRGIGPRCPESVGQAVPAGRVWEHEPLGRHSLPYGIGTWGVGQISESKLVPT
jgi:hypothetical protein